MEKGKQGIYDTAKTTIILEGLYLIFGIVYKRYDEPEYQAKSFRLNDQATAGCIAKLSLCFDSLPIELSASESLKLLQAPP